MNAGRRVLVGENLFMTAFTNIGQGKRKSASPHLIPARSSLSTCNSSAVPSSPKKTPFSAPPKASASASPCNADLGTGIFGGEGFIMEKLDGDGLAFVHAGGYIIEKELQPGEILKVDTGCVVAYQPSVDFDIEFIKGIRNWMFGGEGVFFAIMRGPGKVWLQSLPISRLASRIIQYSPQFGQPPRRRQYPRRPWVIFSMGDGF